MDKPSSIISTATSRMDSLKKLQIAFQAYQRAFLFCFILFSAGLAQQFFGVHKYIGTMGSCNGLTIPVVVSASS
jgi:hypothetical protein